MKSPKTIPKIIAIFLPCAFACGVVSAADYDKFVIDINGNVGDFNALFYDYIRIYDCSVQLKVRSSYKVAKADAITIYDDEGHKLKYFPPTRQTGLHVKWDV